MPGMLCMRVACGVACRLVRSLDVGGHWMWWCSRAGQDCRHGVAGSSLGDGLDRPWSRIGEVCIVGVEDDGGRRLDLGSDSKSESRYPTGILAKRVVKEPLLVELVACQSKGLGCLKDGPIQIWPVSYLSKSRGFAEAV